MTYKANLIEKMRPVWAGGGGRPLPKIRTAGYLSILAYALFMTLPFFIPNTVKSHFPPYLELPQGGFDLEDYYLLYLFICLNALVIFGLYLYALRTASAASRELPAVNATEASGRKITHTIILFSVLFHLLMLAMPFLLSTDIFDYIRHGRILAVYGENPLVIPATYFPHDPFFTLGGWVGTGSVYGSLHVYLTAALSRLAGDGFMANFFAFKGFFVSMDLINLWLIWKITARLQPGLETKALLFYGWNPFVLILVVANAHNDILMLTLMLAGFLLYLDKKLVLGALCIVLATLVKFITLPILVVYLAVLIRRQPGLVRRLAVGAGMTLICAAIFVVSYIPLWAGRETFNYLTTVGQKTNFTLSSLIRDAAANHIHLSLSNTIVQLALAAVLAAYLLWHVLGVKDTAGLLSAAAGLAFLTPLVLFWFQPWYLTLALGLVALRPHGLMFIASLAFSFSVMFFDSFWWHAPVSMDIQKPLRVMVVFGPPVLLLLWLKGREVVPGAWRRLVVWSLVQAGSGRSGRIALAGETVPVSDPSLPRLAVEVSLLFVAALVPMAAVVSSSPRLQSMAELIFLKIQLLVS
ncbi:MAG: glycosyltransferase 87 family protein [Thermoleophilia bacterium]